MVMIEGNINRASTLGSPKPDLGNGDMGLEITVTKPIGAWLLTDRLDPAIESSDQEKKCTKR